MVKLDLASFIHIAHHLMIPHFYICIIMKPVDL